MSAEILDFAKLLAPIPGDKPTGVDPRADSSPNSAYYAIKDARNAARAAERQFVAGTETPAAPPDWRPVFQQATKALAEKTKDLEITAYLIEALVRMHGFSGLRDGFHLAREFVDRFWDGLYPLPDEEGIETRVAPVAGLNGDDAEGTLIIPIRAVPITEASSEGRLASYQYTEALNVAKTADAKLREKKIAAGAISVEKFAKAVAESSPAFYTTLVDDLTSCQQEFAKLTTALEQKCAGHVPPSTRIRDALTNVLDIIRDVARDRLTAPAKVESPSKDGAIVAPASATTTAAPAPPADVIQTREDAFRQLLTVAEFFQRTEPHSVVSYALEQVVRWGRTPLPDLLTELIPEEAARKALFRQIGIKPPDSSGKDADKKK